MKVVDFIEANLRYFERIALSVKNEYGYDAHNLEWRKVAEMMMPGLNLDCKNNGINKVKI